MSIESEVSNLTAQTTALLDAVNVAKATLDAKVTAAAGSAGSAAAEKSLANTARDTATAQAVLSAGSASQSLAIYGTTNAMQAALNTAAAQSQLAQTAASSASSVLQQDLSAVSAALHRSPNPVTAMFLYDTSKDSDGGSWCERMQHTSWYNEALNGAWRGALASEAACRAISGAATSDYFQATTDGKFYKLNAGSGITEVFRGNTAKFPRLAMIVAEASNVTIYDLTQPGRPMWMRFASANAWNSALIGFPYISSLATVNGTLMVGTNSNSQGLLLINFIKDSGYAFTSGGGYGGDDSKTLAQRNAPGHTFKVGNGVGLSSIANTTVNAVAVTVLPDAPFDVATGIQIPTIAVATGGGVSVIKHDGTVKNLNIAANTNIDIAFNNTRLYVSGVPGTNAGIFSTNDINDVTVSAANYFATYGMSQFDMTAPNECPKFKYSVATKTLVSLPSTGGISLLREHQAIGARSLAAKITDKFNTGYKVGDVRRAYLCNTEVESVAGAELVANGAFDTGITGWSLQSNAAGQSISVMNGALRLQNGTAVGYAAFGAAISTVIGKLYAMKWTKVGGTTPAATNYQAFVGTTSCGSDIKANIAGAGLNLEASLFFVALGTTTYISFGSDGTNAINYYVDYDNISVKEIIPDRSYKAIGASIVGTLIKTPVAAAAQLVAFSGFSAANYISESWSTDLDFGVGEFSVGAWVSYTAAVVTTIAERSAASGPGIKLATTATGNLVAVAFDGTTTRTVTTPSTYNTGIFTKATANYTAAGKLSINVNGVEVASATGTPLLTMNNAAAVLTIGNSRTLDAPFPGSITLLKVGATVPTPEQEMWMYEQEKQMFRPGVQITLPDATPVLDLSYDELQDKWTAVQAGSESSFTGLVRTASSTVSAGNFTKVVVGSGIKVLARNATNPGVDIQIPAYGLREELVKRAEAAAKTSKTPPPFDFDSVAGQTEFVLPMGWKAAGVISAGNTQREGATKNFTRLFDGFRETVRFAVAPGAGVWVRINAIKE